MPAEDIETQDLRVFLAVARHGSLSAAAKELFLSTPSVGSRIAALEAKVGAPLFTRHRRGSALTGAGEQFLPYAQRCLAVLDDARRAIRSSAPGHVVVSTPATLAPVLLPEVVTVLGEKGLRTRGRVAHSHEVVLQLTQGSADVGFLLNGVAPPALMSRRLARSALVTVARKGHPLARRACLETVDLLTTPLTVYRWNSEAETLVTSLDHPDRPATAPVTIVGLPSVALDMVLLHDHVAVVPEFSIAATPGGEDSLSRLPLALPDWSLDVQLMFRRDAQRTVAVQALVEAAQRLTDRITTTR
ncbi:LysR family transcriptional regulator [Kineosporia sp. J2-2]|uniref:LysR family transcriptional regulator n=1 Tax=Kineosporia corallincola TaxID=2835133 RepID=A0ABS5TTA8_9ACTN|nr:LysR family transcriptional regulator [Kineosporia corallincola]MBT0774023.1 LysR family transcriptional regulator [Kineosporia corallincola]